MDAALLEEQYNRDLEEMTDEIQAGIKEGRYSLGEVQRSLTNKTKEAAEAAEKFVRSNPWAALGAAIAAGCLIGYCLRRR
jgi:ElaB/YqjD/DUF883 family membrane-anchored ribosome-binding protein